MLILSRRLDEKIDLFWSGEHVVVTICGVDEVDNMVKIGIEAPDNVKILRREVTRKRMREDKERSMQWDSSK